MITEKSAAVNTLAYHTSNPVNAFTLLASLTNGATVRCARCQHLVNYDQVAVLRSRRRRQAIAFCRQCAQGGAA